MKLAIVILNFNCRKETIECLKSLRFSTNENNQVIVADNASEDNSLQLIKAVLPRIKIIQNNENLGYAGGNNVGIKDALGNGADYILILNPDVLVKKGTIKQLLAAAKATSAGIVGPKILTPNGKIWSGGGVIDKKRFTAGLIGLGEADRGQYPAIKNVDFVSGTAMLVKKEVFEKVGPFDERYFLYYEDVDFCRRAEKAGFKVVLAPLAVVIHKESSAVSQKSGLKEYYLARNHWLFLARWAPWRVKIREILRLPKTIFDHWRKKEFRALAGVMSYFVQKTGILLACFWIAVAFGIYFLLWFFRFLEPWQKSLPVMSVKESLRYLWP